MNRRVGGKAKHGHKQKHISDGDVYFEQWQADLIFEYLKPHFPESETHFCFDECANDGVLMKGINKNSEAKYFTGITHDIKDDGICAMDCDSLSDDFIKPDIIVCNPPWKESFAKPLFHKLSDRLSDSGVLFFIINNVFMYQGVKRARDLHCQKYYFLPRYIFKSQGRPLIDCGIAIRHKGQMSQEASNLDCFINIPREKAQ